MLRSKQDLKQDIEKWCVNHLVASKYDQSCPLDKVIKRTIRALIKVDDNQQLLRDLVFLAQSRSRKKGFKSIEFSRLKKQVFNYLGRIIKKSLQSVQYAKITANTINISDDSLDSNTRQNSKVSIDVVSEELIDSTSTFGHPIFGDKIEEIIDVFSNERTSAEQHKVLIEWKQRKNGIKLQHTVLELSDLLYFYPKISKEDKIFKSESVRVRMAQSLRQISEQRRE